MTISITEYILNPQQISACMRFLQVGRDYEAIRYASRVSTEAAKALEYEKSSPAHLEREASQSDEVFEQVVRKQKSNIKDKEGGNSNVEM